MMVLTPNLENQTTKLSSCTLQAQLYSPVASFSQAQAIEPEQETAEPTGETKNIPFVLKSLAAELLDWLIVGLIGARAKGRCGNVAKSGGMWFRSPFLQFSFAYIQELD